ncbi:hypothetical protein LS482_12655 [Sinomicrobium kalidii]|uniref:hypothetical protein n=1 Tax=Sinomicrobium kalidii TaxID=2900738 RepID=UPI001E3AC54F|nr:hypothetical protein [Sinomicrobium kalidii]UGU14545.1 hypothetical protein LS482_12655 [Sinomicrobium kalidii]
MLKSILNLDGAKKLSKKEQGLIRGGYACKLESDGSYSCPNGTYCDYDTLMCYKP